MRMTALLLMTLFNSTAFAQSEEIRVFLQIDGGVSHFAEGEINGEKVAFEDGWSVGLRLGFSLANLGFEFEYGLHEADGLTQSGVEVNPLTLTVGGGAHIKFLRTSWLDWYGGAGGFAGVPINGDEYGDEKDFNAYIETGLVIKPTNNIHLVPHYRLYVALDLVDADGSEFIHTARLGLRFTNGP